jgi:4-amino-4-deoxy-L-arabinose transferase-like glycosyltransferase
VQPLSRRERVALAAILVVGLALRLAYILGQRQDVLFDYPVVDEESYVRVARNLAAGIIEQPAWWHPPGLAYVLAGVFRVFGRGLLAPRVVQACVSTGSCALAFLVARRLFTPAVALATAGICAVHGVLVFESYELLPPTWVLAADLVAVWLLLVARDKRDKRTVAWALAAGLALGVSALFAPTILPFAIPAAVWLRKRALVAALLLGAVLPIAPVTWGNWERDHELTLISTNGGINFYLGNNERYDETLALRPGRHWEELTQEPVRAGADRAGSASSYFLHRGMAFVREHPAAATALFARKLFLYFDGAEIPRDTDIYAARDQSPLLAALVWTGPPFLPDGLLIPLALAGAVVCWRDRRKLFVAYALVATLAIVTAAFFVTSRYRVPALPFFAMFGAAAVASAPLRRTVAVLYLALSIPLNMRPRECSSYASELEFYRGLAYQRYRHEPVLATDHFRRATAANPADERFWFELGNALDASGDGGAMDAWRRAADLDPWDSRARRRIAQALVQRGDLVGASEALEANIRARARDEAHYAPDHLNLGFLLARRGEWDAAVTELAASAHADPSYFAGHIDGLVNSVRGLATTDAARFAWFELAVERIKRDAGAP